MDGDGKSRLTWEQWCALCARNAKSWRDLIAQFPSVRRAHVCTKKTVEIKYVEKITGFIARVFLCKLCETDRTLGS